MGDARSLSDDTLATLRARAVAMVAAGATQAAAAQALGVHKNTVSRWLQAWRAAGDARSRPSSGGAVRASRSA